MLPLGHSIKEDATPHNQNSRYDAHKRGVTTVTPPHQQLSMDS
jgi:hypothetical protein